jgi:hypothetical protein
MTDHAHADEPLSRAEIRERLAFFIAEDRRLTQVLANMYRSGQSGQTSPAADDRESKARAAAATMLAGAASRILPKKAVLAGQTEADVLVLRDGVRLILDSLSRKDSELAEAERRDRARKLEPEFKALIREWLAAAQKLAQIDARAQAFLDAAGDAAALLPMSAWVGGGVRSPWGHDLTGMIATAKAEGVKI